VVHFFSDGLIIIESSENLYKAPPTLYVFAREMLVFGATNMKQPLNNPDL
jgi:hypothetical protein